MPGKPSQLRYRTMLAEVERQAQEALRKGVFSNPYPPDDKRHDRFQKRLAMLRAVEAIFDL